MNIKHLLLSIVVLMFPQDTFADPMIGELILPPASFTRVEDQEILYKLGIGRTSKEYSEPVWCYSEDANEILLRDIELRTNRFVFKFVFSF